jgi:hypothetical protein
MRGKWFLPKGYKLILKKIDRRINGDRTELERRYP